MHICAYVSTSGWYTQEFRFWQVPRFAEALSDPGNCAERVGPSAQLPVQL